MMIINIHLFNKISKFLKESYSLKVRKVLFWIFIIGLSGIWIFSSYQRLTIDERIATRQSEIEADYQRYKESWERDAEKARSKYEECKSAENQNGPTRRFIDPCRTLDSLMAARPVESLSVFMSTDKDLRNLQEVKKNLESNFYDSIALVYFLAFVVAIPAVRFLLLVGALLLSKSQATSVAVGLEFRKMSSFQKYSLILSVLILIALVAVILILLI